ncbi:MAG: hypothetical protein NT062_38660 [Proteobacteria bacterium]|nr:hypothetical protein [Pseudomonadota bacterium]
MSRVPRGRIIKLSYQERGATGRPTLVVDVSADDDILPHEHREDMRDAAAAALGMPLAALEGVEVELKKVGGDHEHPHPHPHPEEATPPTKAKPVVLPPKAKA